MLKKKTQLIGIAGGSGSGKTTICQQLVAELGDLANLLACDNYYLSQAHLNDANRAKVNFDHPETIDFDLLDSHLDSLANGVSIEMPEYCFATHARKNTTVKLSPRPITIVEGILLYSHDAVRNKFDLRIFVDAESDLRFHRRLGRDIAERGRTHECVESQWKQTVEPMYERFVAPTKAFAHVTIDTSGNQEECERAIQTLADGLKEMVEA